MIRRSLRRRFIAAVVLVTLLLPAFALALPMDVHLRGADTAAWAEVCTTDGIQRLAVSDETGGSEPPDAGRAHCPLCLPNGNLLAFLPPPPPWVPALPAASTRPAYPETPGEPPTGAIWPAFHSRGPPPSA